MQPLTRNSLYSSAQRLCHDFAEKKDIQTILSHFSRTHQCTAIEHGLPILAPFLGRPFTGLDAIKEYFTLVVDLLSYEDMEFSEYTVDVEASRVCVKGNAKFTWKSTGKSWEESFVYMLDFDDEAKVTDYQVWADSGAAYLASKGELGVRRLVTSMNILYLC
jgi:hypothetical protein